jgi:hypothetical protein
MRFMASSPVLLGSGILHAQPTMLTIILTAAARRSRFASAPSAYAFERLAPRKKKAPEG